MLTIEFFTSRAIFLSVGGVQIYWYGVLYVLAFWLAWFTLPWLGKKRGIVLSRDAWTTIIAYGALGVVLGGRLGYAFLYEPTFFLQNPEMLMRIWGGGMSSHGGFLGAILGVWWACRREGVLIRSIADMSSVPAALGLALGRLGNIINEEFGIYPYYEAIGNMLIAGICYVLLLREKRVPDGAIFAFFLILYSVQRFLLEYIRPQEWSYVLGLTRGQILTIPLLILGVILLKNALKSRI